MKIESVADAIDTFHKKATDAGLAQTSVAGESKKEHIWHALRHGAGIRLIWRETNEDLSLDISHGPPTGDIAGWLNLYAKRYSGGHIPPQETEEDSFGEALDYALELMTEEGKGAPNQAL